MNIVFWQNMISLHQSALIKSLANSHSVTLVVPVAFEEKRVSCGWQIPCMGKARIIIAPDVQDIKFLICKNPDIIHIFSGFNTYPMLYFAFRIAIQEKCTIFVHAEPYRAEGIKGFLRKMKYSLINFRYGKYISALLATGELGVLRYIQAGFSECKIFEWGYFTESSNFNLVNDFKKRKKPNMLFVGQLIPRKNIKKLLEVALKNIHLFENFYIIGDGILSSIIKKQAAFYPQIKFLGSLDNEETRSLMNQCDLLVLPSLFDGWGAVVNEALQAGMRVLCSESCGSASLLDNTIRGGTFDSSNPLALEKALRYWLRQGVVSSQEKIIIKKWADDHISGQSAAAYLEMIMKYVSGNLEVRPIQPWNK